MMAIITDKLQIYIRYPEEKNHGKKGTGWRESKGVRRVSVIGWQSSCDGPKTLR